MQIRTNNVPRPLLTWFELTKEQQDQLDCNGWGEVSAEDWKGFVFKGLVYGLDEFTVFEHGDEKEAGWDAGMPRHIFHAVLIKLDKNDLDSVVVGQAFY